MPPPCGIILIEGEPVRERSCSGWVGLLGLLLQLHAPLASSEESADDSDAGDLADSEEESATLYDRSEYLTAAPDEARGWDVAPGIEPEDVVLAPPRVLLTPPRGLLQLVFYPVRGLLWVTERHNIIPHVENILYWDDAHDIGFLPVVSYTSGMGLTGGFNVFHNSLLGYDETLRASIRFGGRFQQGYQIRFKGDRIGGSRLWMDTRVRFEVNPRLYFAGIGSPRPVSATGGLASPFDAAGESWYHQQRFLGLLRIGTTLGQQGRKAQVGVTGIVNRREFGAVAIDEVSIEQVYDTAQLPGFENGATTLEVNGTLIVDTRATEGLDSSGGYLELFAGGAVPVNGYTYAHYGVELSGTINLYKHTRLLTFRAAMETVHGDTDRIPFTDLPRLGGADRMRGYLEDQFRDEKLALASVEYHYPIHDMILGQLFIDAGYVAAEYRELFGEIDRWRIGGGGGFIFGSADSISLRLDLSYGDGFHVFISTDLAAAFDGRSSRL